MIAVNKRKRFTVRELAAEFGVSSRTIMRDLQTLDELGLPLYAEYGPHGGYRVLNDRMLPPIMFSEQEAAAMFFACQSLQHCGAVPFAEPSATALNKFYYYLPDDTKQTIDKMKQRVIFVSAAPPKPVPHLPLLLEGALRQRPLDIVYASGGGDKPRAIVPIGVYFSGGLWYCPAYCYSRQSIRLFRVDRVRNAAWADESLPAVDLSGFPISEWFNPSLWSGEGYTTGDGQKLELSTGRRLTLVARLTAEGVRRWRREMRTHEELTVLEDGTGELRHAIGEEELDHFARSYLSWGADFIVREPEELVGRIREELARLNAAYLEVR